MMLQLREGKDLKIGQKIRVYRNLHKGLFSIQDYKTKKVIAHGDGILIKNVNFTVYKKGQEKVRRTRQKAVHAYVVGEFLGEETNLRDDLTQVFYNPYETDDFVELETMKPIQQSSICLCLNNRCYVK